MTPAEVTPEWRAEADAHKRAMPLQRLSGNGMDYADVVELYHLVDDGIYWSEAAERLGDRNFARATEALTAGHQLTAATWFRFAAACFRVGQVPLLDDDPRKSRMYGKLIDAFGRAGEVDDPPVEHVEIPWSGAALCGWLLRPAGVVAPPTAIVLGGFDGWREEYYVGATYLLARGIAVLLIDGPGQGETRLSHGLVMDASVADAFSRMVDFLIDDSRLSDVVAIWGNSMGGFLAALTATQDERIAACVVNGGTVRPGEILDRFPRFVSKVQPLLGVGDPEEARAAMGQFELAPDQLERLTCPLLVLHGTPDQVFLVENARALFDAAGSQDKTFREWPDGDHCIYNHSHEKHVLVADWLGDRLKTGR
ncbi:alpha/beta hydrolase family protein [Pseudolysinimonas yzui]|uniref:Dipeptidyl aminopeptidase n=1 Tax=Pseudolysinimonas yzui TaxID=2708254 RepID=A0A8J3GSG5_9MICO|nr:alpha/beta fold hydrolase [Pseudolysinimonas yzui]GHF22583.1 dipeptidyl aminopeptidase [Pseudolysinimonas yzui]